MNASLTLAALLVAAPVPDKGQTVPFELLKSGHMAVQVKINGKGPFRLIFDTGAPITLLSRKVARAAGLVQQQEQPALPLFGAGGEVKIGRLDVGGVTADDVPGIVMDHPTVEALARAVGPLDGIVGFPFFARFRTTIDYQAKTLTLAPSGFKPPDVMRSLMLALLSTSGDEVQVLARPAVWGFRAEKDAKDDAPGVIVKSVLPASAAAAGLKPGDRLLTLNGRWTDSLADLQEAASRCKPGKAALLRIRRGDRELEVQVTPRVGL